MKTSYNPNSKQRRIRAAKKNTCAKVECCARKSGASRWLAAFRDAVLLASVVKSLLEIFLS